MVPGGPSFVIPPPSDITSRSGTFNWTVPSLAINSTIYVTAWDDRGPGSAMVNKIQIDAAATGACLDGQSTTLLSTASSASSPAPGIGGSPPTNTAAPPVSPGSQVEDSSRR